MGAADVYPERESTYPHGSAFLDLPALERLTGEPVRTSYRMLRAMGVIVLFDPDAPYEGRLPSWRDVLAALPAPAFAR